MIFKYRNKWVLFTVVSILLTVIVTASGCATSLNQTVYTVSTELACELIAEPELMVSFFLDRSNNVSDYEDLTYFDDFESNSDVIYYDANLHKATRMINGTVIKPGETISLNDILGPRTAKNKWLAVTRIKGRKRVKEFGDGVNELATVLYNAAIRAELQVVSHTLSLIPTNLADGGLDAIISTNGADLKIKNPYASDVTIETKVNENYMIVISIYGPHRDYTVDYRSDRIQSAVNPDILYYYDSVKTPDGFSIHPGAGAFKMYKEPKKGVTFKVYKTRYDLDGNEIDTVPFCSATYAGCTGLAYVNAPDPATAEPTPAPTPMPTAKVK